MINMLVFYLLFVGLLSCVEINSDLFISFIYSFFTFLFVGYSQNKKTTVTNQQRKKYGTTYTHTF